MANKKEIQYLDDYEYILKRPTIYVGSVEKTEEKIPIVEKGRTILKEKEISVGFYKLLNEIVDNAMDEAKRCQGKMKSLKVEIFSKTNRVIVTDTGDGFYEGHKKNKKTGVSNIETAMSKLKSGSNFNDDNRDDKVIGVNGLGAALVNVLSDVFEIKTSDGTRSYYQKWEDFKSVKQYTRKSKKKGTKIDFIPRKDIFSDCSWDKEIIQSSFVFRNYLKDFNSDLKKLKIDVRFDNEKLDLDIPFYDKENSIEIRSNKLGKIIAFPNFPGSTRLSFINGQLCTGIHQKILQDHLNELCGDDKAHHLYETIIALDLEPKMVVFGDQNKTLFRSKRSIIQPLYDKYFKKKVKREFVGSNVYDEIQKRIEERRDGKASKDIDKISKSKKIKLSSKYKPATKSKDLFFIVEGDSAMGASSQRRDPNTMGFYALKGKVMNVKKMSKLTSNKEISDLIQIIGLDPNGKKKPKYKKIIIATDEDADGGHISALLLNLFYKWFPYMIEKGYVYKLITPLITGKYKGKWYTFNSLAEYNKFGKKLTDENYIKGLGSLTPKEWEIIFKDMELVQFKVDDQAEESITLAFGDDVSLRKKWLVE